MEKLVILLWCVLASSRASEYSRLVTNGVGGNYYKPIHISSEYMVNPLEQLSERFPVLRTISQNHPADNSNWYIFLFEVYIFFASYEVQKDVTVYNVADLSDWGEPNKPQGLQITDTNFLEFTKLLPNITAPATPYSLSKLKELNEIIDITLRSPPQFECQDDSISVRGIFIKTSDIRVEFPPLPCPSNSVSKLNVFALNTFYVDDDLNLDGYEELNIVADKWEILRSTSFNLNGFDGEEQGPSNTEGRTGESGKAGTNAGNFFGSADKIINGHLLRVSLNGGNGANGQDGTGSRSATVSFTSHSHKRDGNDAPKYYYNQLSSYYKEYLQDRGYKVQYIGYLPIEDPLLKVGVTARVGLFVHTYRLHPKQCCGQTGRGGSGGYINSIY